MNVTSLFICEIKLNFLFISSIPPQYVGSSTFHHDGNGDVVIVVPSMDVTDMDPIIDRGGSGSGGVGIIGSSQSEHSICIETEADIEPTSPKTITESSSKLICF